MAMLYFTLKGIGAKIQQVRLLQRKSQTRFLLPKEGSVL